MARPRVADGGDGLQIWRADEKILNNQSRKPTKDVPPARGVGRWASNSSPYNKPILLRNVAQGFEFNTAEYLHLLHS